MADFFELDFLDVEAKKSGDAIPLRYELNGQTYIHVVDGGFQDTGAKIVEHIRRYYGNPNFIDHVVLTHQDGDHAGGLEEVLNEFEVGALWMLRPWLYAQELVDRFSRFSNVDNLVTRLKEIYPNIKKLESIATENGIPIYEPLQGGQIGAFAVLAPSKSRYLDLIVASDKTPDAAQDSMALSEIIKSLLAKAVNFVKSSWGVEVFSTEETSAENEMSVVQFANLSGEKILLTGDVGRGGLAEAADYAPYAGLDLPGIDRFQVPHHGSRRNVSTEILDRLLGTRLQTPLAEGSGKFTAIISSAKLDEDHPRKAVVRACMHRGGRVFPTEEYGGVCSHGGFPPNRGWGSITPVPYPDEQED